MTEKELMDTFNYQFRNVELIVDENYGSYLQPEDVTGKSIKYSSFFTRGS